MKQVFLYGPSSSPHILVSDEEAERIRAAVKSGESFEITIPKACIFVRENACWAIKIEDFNDRRSPENQ